MFALALRWKLDPDNPGRALLDGYENSTTTINGLHMWVCALRVRRVGGEHSSGGALWAWEPWFEDEFEAVLTLVGCRPETTTLPGLDGEWVIYAVPHGD